MAASNNRTWMQKRLQEMELTTDQAAIQCGVSLATMQIVAGGSPTLPCLALKIGKGLGLTREEVKPLGKPLNANAWGKNGLPAPNEIDLDPAWWERLPRSCAKKAAPVKQPKGWLNILAVMERLIVLDMDQDDLKPLLGRLTLNAINGLSENGRAEWIERLEDALKVNRGGLSANHRVTGTYSIGFAPDYERIRKLMEKPGNSRRKLARKLYPSPSGLETLDYNLGRIEMGEWFSMAKGQRWAEALGVKLQEIGEKRIRIY